MSPFSQKALPSPLLIPLLFWCAGIIAASLTGGLNVTIIWGLAAGLTLVACFIRSSLRTALLLLIILLCGWLRMELGKPRPSPLEQVLSTRESLIQEAEFEVLSLISAEFHSHSVRITRLAGQPVREKALLYHSATLEGGTRWRGILDIQPITDDPIIDIFPRKYKAKIYPKEGLTRLASARQSFSIPRLRATLLRQLDINLGSNSGFAKALLLSDVSSQNEHRTELTRGGMIHLIVVSGMHVWFIYAICMTLLYLFLPRRVSELLFLALILVFSALNNWSPPILRATLMIGLLVLAGWLERPVASAQLLALSLIIITAIDPNQLFSVSLILSYTAIIAVMYGVPRYYLWKPDSEPNRITKLIKSQLDYLILSVLVGLAMLPVTHYFFGTGSLNGIVGNLLGIPLSGLILPLAFLMMLIPQSFIFLPQLRLAYDFLVSCFFAWTKLAAKLPFYSEGVYWSPWISLAMVLGVILLILVLRGRWKLLRYGTIPAILTIAAFLLLPPLLRKTDETLYVFNSGVSDVSLLRLKGDINLMIDTGQVFGTYAEVETLPEEKMLDHSWLRQYLLRWFSREGIHRIDWLVLTHMHNDHVGGLPSLLKAMPVNNIIITDESLKSSTWKYLTTHGYLKHSRVYALRDTLSLRLGASRLKFLHPDKDYFTDRENNRSIVLRLDHGDKRYLFTGDIEASAESYLAEKYPDELDADYLKVPHHGSAGSSTPAFLEAVSPEEAWITVSKRNRYAFPHRKTLLRYKQQGTILRRTSDGTIVVPLDHRD